MGGAGARRQPRHPGRNPCRTSRATPCCPCAEHQRLQVEPDALRELGLSPALLTPSRSNGFHTLLQRMRRLATSLHKPLPRFPSLVIKAGATEPQGAFAQAQDRYLQPDGAAVDRLARVSTLAGQL